MRHKRRNNKNNNNHVKSNKSNNTNNSNSGNNKSSFNAGNADPRPKGFANLGNTCYLNSILQVLMNAPTFGEILASDGKLAELQGCDGIIIALINLYKNYHLTGVQSSLTPSNIIKHIRQKSGRFHRFEQEDSHELLRSLLDIVRTDELKRKRIPSIVDTLFSGYFLSSVKCNKCNHLSQHLEAFYDISLAISGTDTLSEALKRFSASETLDGANKIHCDKCKKYEVGSKSTRIAIPPSILTLHFKRFEVVSNSSKLKGGSSLSKISKNVEFSEALDLSKYTSDLYYDSTLENSSTDDDKENNSQTPYVVAKKPLSYSLFGVVCHSGGLKGGHYTAFVRYNKPQPIKGITERKHLDMEKIFKTIKDYNHGRGYFDHYDACDDDETDDTSECSEKITSSNDWYHVSDTSVSRSNISHVLKSQAYILFYERDTQKCRNKEESSSDSR